MKKKRAKFFLLTFVFLGLVTMGGWYWFYGCGLETDLVKRFQCYSKRGQTEKAIALVEQNKFGFRRIFYDLVGKGLKYRYQQKPDSAGIPLETAGEIARVYEQLLGDGFLRQEFDYCNGLGEETLRKKITLDSLYLQGYRKKLEIDNLYIREHHSRKDYSEAQKNYEESLQLCREIGDRKREVDNHIQIQTLFFAQDMNDKVVERGKEALSFAKQIGYREREVWIVYNMGRAYFTLANYHLALEAFDAALPIARQLEDQMAEVNLLHQKGIALTRLGKVPASLAVLNQAIELAGKTNNLVVGAESHIARADVSRRMGQYTRAREDANQALRLVENLEDADDKALIYANLGGLYSNLGVYEEALANLFKASELYRQSGRGFESATTLIQIGDVYFDQGQSEEALQQYRQAQEIIREMEDKGSSGFDFLKLEILRGIGDVYNQEGQYDLALETYREPLKKFREIESRQGIAQTLTRLAEVLRKKGQFNPAEACLAEAREIARALQDPLLIASSEFTMGMVAQDRRQFSRAEESFLAAIQTVESTREEIQGEERINYFATIQNIYDAMILLQLSQGKNEAAFDFSERSRARDFLDILKDDSEKPGGELTAQINPSTLAEIQRSLGEKVQLIEYKITRDKLLIFWSDGSALKVAESPIFRKELGELVYEFRKAIGAEDYDAFKADLQKDSEKRYYRTLELAQRLYSWLIRPVEKYLLPDKTLCIIPDETLFYLPFAALAGEGDRREKFLIQQFTISFAPSASILKYSVDHRKKAIAPEQMRLFALADPVGDLPYSEKEVRAIAGMFSQVDTLIGPNVREDVALQHIAKNFDVLHFATHANINGTDPRYSHLVLGIGTYLNGVVNSNRSSLKTDPDDDLLMAYEVLKLNLSQARLANLSACRTSGGRLFRGEGIVGLTRAFIKAGASSVITSLWDIDDQYTERLMSEFYRQWIKNKKTKAEALREAQLEIIRELAKDPQFMFPHPHHWAAFTLTGDFL